MAAASAASTALPPVSSIRRPAWAASGCDVENDVSRKRSDGGASGKAM
jgi:hypothetical protein